MKNPRSNPYDTEENPQDTDLDIFDREPIDEDDLWFLPGSDHASLVQPHDLPLPVADQTPLVDVDAWAAAEAGLARPLADLAMRVGILRARLARGRQGWRLRLALREAADLSWLAGDRVPIDRLALWLTLRLAGDNDDAQALARAGWAVRRLQGGADPSHDLGAFLGRQSDPQHQQLDHQIADWHEVMAQGEYLHPLTRGALGFHLWSVVGLSAGHALGGAAPLPLMEAAVVASRSAVQGGDESGPLFLPLALGGAGGLRGTGTTQDRLRRWIAGADHATRAALRILDSVEVWETEAMAACAGQSGRTPPLLIGLLRDWPLVSAPMAESETGASRAAVQRNLNWMTKRGIIREVTGQGRYRYWTARV